MFYLTTHSTHFIYGYLASGIWLRTILIAREETRCRHMGYSFRLAARVLLYAPSHRQDSTYHGLCYTSRGALAGTRNSSMGPPHEGSIRRPIAPWANALPLSYVPLPTPRNACMRNNYISLTVTPLSKSLYYVLLILTFLQILVNIIWRTPGLVKKIVPSIFAFDTFRIYFDFVFYLPWANVESTNITTWIIRM